MSLSTTQFFKCWLRKVNRELSTIFFTIVNQYSINSLQFSKLFHSCSRKLKIFFCHINVPNYEYNSTFIMKNIVNVNPNYFYNTSNYWIFNKMEVLFTTIFQEGNNYGTKFQTGREGTIACPVRTPDLRPLHLFGHLKSVFKVFILLNVKT